MTDRTLPRIGIVGTGIMGGPMACRLAEAGFPVRAWNRTTDKALRLQRSGVDACANVEDLARSSDVVICMLSSGPVCDEVLFAGTGAARAVADVMPAGATLVVMSSIPVEIARNQHGIADDRGLAYVDAPVSGGERGARDGTLAIMAGGDAAVVGRLAPVFAPLGRVTHVGPPGTGQLAKLANQLIVASGICAVAEALVLAERGGADIARVREALLGGFADSTVLRQHGQRMVLGDFAPGGPAKYQVKDTNTVLQLAARWALDLPVARQVDRLFSDLVENGGGELDHSAVIVELRKRNAI